MNAHLPQSPSSAASPFPGERPYAEHEARLFFGRDAEAKLVAEGLAASRLTLLSGPPGVGKTSLLNAGVMPRLREMTPQSGRPPILVFWDDWQGARGDPLPRLIEEIQRCSLGVLSGFDPMRVPRVRALERVIEYWSARAPLFIIFDRFEDYLLNHADDDGEGKFSVEFPRVARRPDLHANFLIAMRGGAHAKLGRLAQRLPQLFDRSLRLKPLRPEAARAAILLPIEVYNAEHPDLAPVHVEPALVDEVMQVAAIAGAETAGAESVLVDAATLQRTMLQMWEAQIEPDVSAQEVEVRVLQASPKPAEAAMQDAALDDLVSAHHPMFTEPLLTDPVTSIEGYAPAAIAAPVAARRGWRSAHGARVFATLAFLFVSAYAMFGAGSWIAHLHDEKQTLSVQEAADRALARARATLAKAAQLQAAREQPAREQPVEKDASNAAGARSAQGPILPSGKITVEPVGKRPEAEPQHATAEEKKEEAKEEEKKEAKRVPEREPTKIAGINAQAPQQHQPAPVVKTPEASSAPKTAEAPATAAPGLDNGNRAAANRETAAATAVTAPPQQRPVEPRTPDQAIAPTAGQTPARAATQTSNGRATAPTTGQTTSPTTGQTTSQTPVSTTAQPAGQAAPKTPAQAPAVEVVEAAPPVTAAQIEKRRATAAEVRLDRNAERKPAQAQASDNPTRPGARVQSYPSNNVIDAARAASPSSPPGRRESSEMFAAESGKKAPVHTAKYDGAAARDDKHGAQPSIFIHVRDQSQLAQTLRLKRRLEASGIVVSGIRTVTRGPDEADLRYFRRNERGEAKQMVDLLHSLNVPVDAPKYIAGFESTATLRQYELWFPAVN